MESYSARHLCKYEADFCCILMHVFTSGLLACVIYYSYITVQICTTSIH